MDKIHELLTRGVDTLYPSKEELEKILRSGKKLKLYQGFDPTGTQLHIGHMIGLRKLAQWQALGHQVIFLIGTGTGQAGDPSGKLTAREKFLSEEELKKNAKDYVMQAKKLLNFEGENAIKIQYNGDWLNKLNYSDILLFFGHFSVQQLLERDLFQDRIKRGEPINLRAFIYPIVQGIDSVKMEVDLEVGGTDQTFNMLCGRQLVKAYLNKEKFVLTTPLLTDSEGRKIGKTEGNVIALNDKPEDLFGKIMALSDDVIVKGLEYLTDIPIDEIKKIGHEIEKGENPVKFKKKLAFEIVKQLNNDQAAKKAQENFELTVQKKELPTEMPQITMKNNTLISTVDLLVQIGLASSKSEAKRLIEQGGVEIDNERVTEPNEEIIIKDNFVVKVGKRKFVEIVIKD